MSRVAVSGSLKRGCKCGLRFWYLQNAVLCAVSGFLSVSGLRFSSNFGAACGSRRKILYLVKNLKYFFDKGR